MMQHIEFKTQMTRSNVWPPILSHFYKIFWMLKYKWSTHPSCHLIWSNTYQTCWTCWFSAIYSNNLLWMVSFFFTTAPRMVAKVSFPDGHLVWFPHSVVQIRLSERRIPLYHYCIKWKLSLVDLIATRRMIISKTIWTTK